MAVLAIKINGDDINTSAQVGDVVYYSAVSDFTQTSINTPNFSGAWTSGNTSTSTPYVTNSNSLNTVKHLGTILALPGNNVIVVETADINVAAPSASDFIFIGKDNKVNIGDLKGYYAEVKFVNDSTTEAELFTISTEVAQSSK